MAESIVNLHHGRRDSYGFALRPQHVQRYREYTHIYKEEEEERSIKWKLFLEHQENLDESEEANEETRLQAPGSEVRIRDNGGGGDDADEVSVSCSGSETSKEHQLFEESTLGTQHTEEGEKVVEGPQQEVQFAVESGKEDPCADECEKNVQETKEEHSKLPKEEVRFPEESGKEEPCADEREKKVQATNEEHSELPKEEVQSLESSPKTPEEVQSLESSPKTPEELHVFEEGVKEDRSKTSKAGKVPNWGQIRPSLKVIEKIMSERVCKQHNVKVNKETGSRDHLPVIEEDGSSEGEPDKDVNEKESSKQTSDNKDNGSMDETNVENEPSSEPFFLWKQELEFLVHGGVPKDIRGEVWQAFVGAKTRRVDKYYEELLAEEANADESNDDNDADIPLKWRKQIEFLPRMIFMFLLQDIPRTFPGHPALDEHGRGSLRRILIAYARHNPSVGYCQAMNFFAGLLLLLMPEENAFWTFVGIIDDYFDGYYTEEMIESQVDQLVFEELMHEIFPRLVSHLEFLGVQVAWVSGPWFLSIFINMLPWESVLRIWDVILFEGNRVMLFRIAFALMELYGPALLTTRDAGDAITLLQSLAGSTFDSSQLVLTACVGFLSITESRLNELREKHRASVLEAIEERSKQGKVWKDSKGLATKLYSFKHDTGRGERNGVGDNSQPGTGSPFDDFLFGLSGDTELDSLPDLQDQVIWLKVELCRLIEEKRSAILRAEELETALMEMVKQDNRRQLSAKIEKLELDIYNLQKNLAEKKEQEAAMLEVLMRVEQEQKITEEARVVAEKEAAAQRREFNSLQEKYDEAMSLKAQMEKRAVMAESMLDATMQYQSGQNKAQYEPPGFVRLFFLSLGPRQLGESPSRGMGILAFGLGWRDKIKNKSETADGGGGNSSSGGGAGAET
ncbi:Putative GTPase-activating protein AN11010 [Linum perenne]